MLHSHENNDVVKDSIWTLKRKFGTEIILQIDITSSSDILKVVGQLV